MSPLAGVAGAALVSAHPLLFGFYAARSVLAYTPQWRSKYLKARFLFGGNTLARHLYVPFGFQTEASPRTTSPAVIVLLAGIFLALLALIVVFLLGGKGGDTGRGTGAGPVGSGETRRRDPSTPPTAEPFWRPRSNQGSFAVR